MNFPKVTASHLIVLICSISVFVATIWVFFPDPILERLLAALTAFLVLIQIVKN